MSAGSAGDGEVEHLFGEDESGTESKERDLARGQGFARLAQGDAKSARGQWIVCVRDNVIGFEPRYAERIFGLFKRLHKEEYPGTGLGLAICKRIVERYGGRIWADGSPGEGAAFYFSLPFPESQ